MAKNVYIFGKTVLEKTHILFAVASVENAYDETARIDVIMPEDITHREPELLLYAKKHMARFLFNRCDVLIVDRIGKEISGDGMDPNITGRFGTKYASGGIDAERVVVLDLTEETHGNGVGSGHADIVTERFVRKLDLGAMYLNTMTSRAVRSVCIPMIMKNDLQAVRMAIASCPGIGPDGPKMIRIPDTLHMQYILVSEALLPEAEKTDGIRVAGGPFRMRVDEDGNIEQMMTFLEKTVRGTGGT